MSNWLGGRIAAVFLVGALATGAANAQASAAPSRINQDEYVQLEVTLTIAGLTGPMRFDFCPAQRLWDIDLDSLLDGSQHVTLGVSIDGPKIPQTVLTPVAIDTRRSGPFGFRRECTISIDQITYRSPAVSVRRHDGASFTIAPTFVRTTAVNPGLTSTITSALTVAATLAGVPAEAAQPYQAPIQNLLNAISVGHQETMIRHFRIAEGATPADLVWLANSALPARRGRAAVDLVVTARIIPISSLVREPQTPTGGTPAWNPTIVLGSRFSELAPGLNPEGTLRGHVRAIASTELNSFRNATARDTASVACEALKEKVVGIGLSSRDTGLLMWALTHDSQPRGAITGLDIDNLQCLNDSWQSVPDIVRATRIPNPSTTLPTPDLAASTTRQMQAATQIDDAFARFFISSTWADRRRIAQSLFSYPATYTDPGALILPMSATLENPDQWLALHTAETPYVGRVGCYAYDPAAQPDGRSRMYAIADLNSSGTQVLLTATFANAEAQSDARIAELTVANSISAERRAFMRAANRGTQCASGYAPALLFSN